MFTPWTFATNELEVNGVPSWPDEAFQDILVGKAHETIRINVLICVEDTRVLERFVDLEASSTTSWPLYLAESHS